MKTTIRQARVLAASVALVASVFGGVVAAPSAVAHTGQGAATPSNDGPHPWNSHPSESSACSTPGVSISKVPLTFNFNHACKHHDGCYQGFPRDGKPTYWVSRKQCDLWFLQDMKASCTEMFGTDLYVGCGGAADTYYAAVRSGGSPGYEGPPDKNN